MEDVITEDCQHGGFGSPCGDEPILIYTPSGFQDPFQLLHLKRIWFQHLYSSYHIRVRQLDRNCEMDQLKSHCAVIGISNTPNSSYSHVDQNWHSQFLSCVLGIPVADLLSSMTRQCCSEEVRFLDKLDLIEQLNYPLAQRRTELQGRIEEDLGIIERNTRMFELEFDSFVQSLDTVSSLFETVLSSLIKTTLVVTGLFCTAAQALRQHVYWINSQVLTALINSGEVTVMPLSNRGQETFLVQLQGETAQMLFCSCIVNPMSVLHWYEHRIAQGVIPVRNMPHSCVLPTVLSETNDTHHWTLDCCRQCDFCVS